MACGSGSRRQQLSVGYIGLQQLEGVGSCAVTVSEALPVWLGRLQLPQLAAKCPEGPLHFRAGLWLQQQPCRHVTPAYMTCVYVHPPAHLCHSVVLPLLHLVFLLQCVQAQMEWIEKERKVHAVRLCNVRP